MPVLERQGRPPYKLTPLKARRLVAMYNKGTELKIIAHALDISIAWASTKALRLGCKPRIRPRNAKA